MLGVQWYRCLGHNRQGGTKMNVAANIIVQLIHIDGPQKGEIQELSCPIIRFGRYPDCQVQFPRDAVALSRKHAKIVRQGNRFKLIDQSSNGTFVNGQPVSEAYLKQGDVITFADCGPKISFLTLTSDQPAPSESVEASLPLQTVVPPSSSPAVPSAALQNTATPTRPEAPAPAASLSEPAPPVRDVAMPPAAQIHQSATIRLAIQYGPMLKVFKSLPITLGKGVHCDFVINHSALFDQQAQVFFDQDHYWIKDLTGTNAVLINNMPITGQAVLHHDMQLSLSRQGPKFRFLGNGRLVELEAALPEASQAPAPAPAPRAVPEVSRQRGMFRDFAEKAQSLFQKVLK